MFSRNFPLQQNPQKTFTHMKKSTLGDDEIPYYFFLGGVNEPT